MRGRLRVLALEADQFPNWWTKSAVTSAMSMVASRPDVVVLPMPQCTWTRRDFEAAARVADASRRPTVVYYPFDSWDDPARGWQGPLHWRDRLRRYVARADLVAGPQLPLEGGPRRTLALPYPPLVRRRSEPAATAATTWDVHFAGAYRDPGWAGSPVDTRDRRYRGHLVRRLREALPAERVVVRQAQYWAEPEVRRQLRRRYVHELDHSRIVLAPAGYGYLTFRHADGWARGRAVLSEALHRLVQVPEPERWERGELCLLYDPAGDDVADVVGAALARPDRLAAVARAGWEYGRCWTDPGAQATQLAATAAAL